VEDVCCEIRRTEACAAQQTSLFVLCSNVFSEHLHDGKALRASQPNAGPLCAAVAEAAGP
jgi:hypothetical protein